MIPPSLSGTPPTQVTSSNSEPDTGLKYHIGRLIVGSCPLPPPLWHTHFLSTRTVPALWPCFLSLPSPFSSLSFFFLILWSWFCTSSGWNWSFRKLLDQSFIFYFLLSRIGCRGLALEPTSIMLPWGLGTWREVNIPAPGGGNWSALGHSVFPVHKNKGFHEGIYSEPWRPFPNWTTTRKFTTWRVHSFSNMLKRSRIHNIYWSFYCCPKHPKI